MYATNFEYDKQYLSDFGFIICDFAAPSGADVVDVGAQIKFNTVSQNNGKRHGLTGTQYDDCIKTTFDICKNPDIYDADEMPISLEEYRDIARWLNRKKFLKFRMIDDDNESCYYEASFNITKIKINEILYGIQLELTTNRPFGFGEMQYKSFEFTDTSMKMNVIDISDEIGYIYPDVSITCLRTGNLTISNSLTGSEMYIANCKLNEEITISGTTHQIASSLSDHNVYDDFNYDYLKIGNTIDNRRNTITTSLPCKLTLKYYPIIKNIPE